MSMYVNSEQPSHLGGPGPDELGWIYIAYDARCLDMCKIGFTRGPLWSRFAQTTANPWYVLFAAFKIPPEDHGEIAKIEKFFHRKIYEAPIQHLMSNESSEWFPVSPGDALQQLVSAYPRCIQVPMDYGEFDFTSIVYFPQVNPDAFADQYGYVAPFLSYNVYGGGYWLAGMTERQTHWARDVNSICAPAILRDRLCFDLVRSGRYPF
ncbi:GIY-YIG nuclease family protein [Variovorax boronicumulans]|uniref:GIY-YIG nuclease family protein n=1 Tax=Variovorax boronicumulans TaxID=436515 RepID=UPI00278267AF|nr:GIY-YIG nuclease family protein [Variovorax boronicumulans]MDQ0045405.1 hypothetical protein [Variovorax boronicumulans]